MAQSTIQGDYYYNGNLSAKTMTLPSGGVGNTQVAPGSGAGNGIAASKLQQQYVQPYSAPKATTAAAAEQVVHVVRGLTGAVVQFTIGAQVANIGDSTVTFDLMKNGSSILTGTVTLTSSQPAYTGQLNGTLGAGAALVAGDVLAVKVTVTAGTGTLAKGVFAIVVVTEDAQ